MTKISENPTPRKLRSLFVRILSDFAREKGFEIVVPRQTGGTTRPPRNSAIVQPDILWMNRGRTMWQFYVLPGPRVLRALCLDLTVSQKIIVCADSCGNLGIVDPGTLLRYFRTNGETLDGEMIQSLTRAFSPAATPTIGYHFTGTVTKSHHFLKDHYALGIGARFAPRPTPGQFLQLMCDPAPHGEDPKYRSHAYGSGRWPRLQGAELLSKRPFLRRPFSIASYATPAEKHALKETARPGLGWIDLVNWMDSEYGVIYRRVPGGPGTGALAAYKTGDKIDVVGPLGKGFNISPPPEVALLAGGGIGATPLIFLAEELVRMGVEVKLFVGAVTRSMVPFRLRGAPKHRIASLEKLGVSTTVCTDDGSAGRRGLVTDPLVEYLVKRPGPGKKIFACGPRPMLAALEGIAIHYDVDCEALLEEMMACGFGACISCVCGVKEAGRKPRFTRICIEGPAFDVKKVMWHA